MDYKKIFGAGIALVILLITVVAGASAYSETVIQRSYYGDRSRGTYDYISPPVRGGGHANSMYVTGLRRGVQVDYQPSHYSTFYRPYCGYPCRFEGSYGYSQRRSVADLGQGSGFRVRYDGFGRW